MRKHFLLLIALFTKLIMFMDMCVHIYVRLLIVREGIHQSVTDLAFLCLESMKTS